MQIERVARIGALTLVLFGAAGCGPSEESQVKADSAIAAAKTKAVTQAGEVLSARREAQAYFDNARTAFVAKQGPAASQALRDAAAFTRRQADSATAPAKEALISAAAELETLAVGVTKGTVKSVKTLDDAFTGAHFAEAQLHCTRALAAWQAKNAAATGAEMMMLVDHFERAASDAGQQLLATPTQQTLAGARSLADKLAHGGIVQSSDVEASLSAMDKEVHSLMTKTSKVKG